jgi:hypothetical protein
MLVTLYPVILRVAKRSRRIHFQMPAQSENIGPLNSQSADFADYTDLSDLLFILGCPA